MLCPDCWLQAPPWAWSSSHLFTAASISLMTFSWQARPSASHSASQGLAPGVVRVLKALDEQGPDTADQGEGTIPGWGVWRPEFLMGLHP